MKKLVIFAVMTVALAVLFSSCAEQATPAAAGTTEFLTTTEIPTTERLSLLEQPTLLAETSTANAAFTTLSTVAQSSIAAQTVPATTAAASTINKSSATTKPATTRYIYTNDATANTTATRRTTSATTSTAASAAANAYNIPSVNASAKPVQDTISFAIDGSAAVPYGYNVSMPARSMALNSGDSVLDLLNKSGFAVQFEGFGSLTYVRAIGGLREKDCGGGSGWKYEVNGTYPSVSCAKYQPKNGDVIVWRYLLTP